MAVTAVAIPASLSVDAAQSVSCSSSHPVVPNDCKTLISLYSVDNTQVIGDSNGRAILSQGSCAIVLKFGANEIESVTRATLAARAKLIDDVCDAGVGFSGILANDAVRNDKYCLCSPSTMLSAPEISIIRRY
ncbi:hypothetical protein C8J56DRAFT_1059981 [Mycena floridula]|nr:hypothetical protein C8J56DRAFT_1059981 [Mycena floridula]